MRAWIDQQAQDIAARAQADVTQLVKVSSPHGDLVGVERMVEALRMLLPDGATTERVACSTVAFAPDLLVSLSGTGQGRLLLLGHLDTVISHAHHREIASIGDAWHGSGAYDMKGGLVIACGVLRALATRPELYETVRLLVTADEEGRSVPLVHCAAPWTQANACLCFEGGESPGQRAAVVVRRKSASSLNVRAHGRAAHSGAAIKEGASALEALARLVQRLTVFAIDGDEEVSVTPTLMQAGEAINIVPSTGSLHCDVRAFRVQTARNMLALVPAELRGVRLEANLEERFPAMDARERALPVLTAAAELLGEPILGVSRGGSSDINFFAERIPVSVDGLGPVGGGDHTPHEYVLGSSFITQSALALAFAVAALDQPPRSPLDDLAWVRELSDDVADDVDDAVTDPPAEESNEE